MGRGGGGRVGRSGRGVRAQNGAGGGPGSSASFGSTFPSLANGPVTFWLLDDPDADLDPRNATALASVDATPALVPDSFFTVALPPTEVSGAFFVGVSAALEGGTDRPARVDTDDDGDQSWFFYDPDIAGVIDSLGTAEFGTRMDDPLFVIFPGAFMIRATGEPRTVSAEDGAPLATLVLEPSAPNPFPHATAIRYTLPTAGRVTVEVFDVTGRRVAVLVDGEQPAGRHEVRWDAGGVPGGAYLCRLGFEREVLTRTLVRVR